MSQSRRGNVLAATVLGIGAGVVTFTAHRALHDEARKAGDRRADVVIGASEARHETAHALVPSPERHDAAAERGGNVAGPAGVGAKPVVAGARDGGDVASMRSPHAAALRHPSESFRNTSLLALIRGAGHVCLDIVSSATLDDELAAWRVSCEGAHAYIVAELDGGEFLVEPLEHYDAPIPAGLTTPFDRLPQPVVPIPLDAPQ